MGTLGPRRAEGRALHELALETGVIVSPMTHWHSSRGCFRIWIHRGSSGEARAIFR